MIFNGDCLEIVKQMDTASIDMIYLDPPFFTQKVQTLKDIQGK